MLGGCLPALRFPMTSHKPPKKTSGQQLVVSNRAGSRWEQTLGVRAAGSIPPSGCPLRCHGWSWVPFPPLSHASAGWSVQDVTPPPPPRHFQRDRVFFFFPPIFCMPGSLSLWLRRGLGNWSRNSSMSNQVTTIQPNKAHGPTALPKAFGSFSSQAPAKTQQGAQALNPKSAFPAAARTHGEIIGEVSDRDLRAAGASLPNLDTQGSATGLKT